MLHTRPTPRRNLLGSGAAEPLLRTVGFCIEGQVDDDEAELPGGSGRGRAAVGGGVDMPGGSVVNHARSPVNTHQSGSPPVMIPPILAQVPLPPSPPKPVFRSGGRFCGVASSPLELASCNTSKQEQ
jgi:hypothetical protein